MHRMDLFVICFLIEIIVEMGVSSYASIAQQIQTNGVNVMARLKYIDKPHTK